jgi:hypothetical protein
MSNLNTFVQNLAGGGARANQYEIQITGSPVPNGTFSFLCRSAQIPGMTVGEVPVAYRGRQIFVAGDRTYDAWTVTVFSDTAWSLRSSFEAWSHQIAHTEALATGATAPNDYYATAMVKQFDRAGGTRATYFLADCWPTTVDPIDLAYDTNDAVMEFGVTLRFNYLTIGAGGAGGGQAGPRGRAGR